MYDLTSFQRDLLHHARVRRRDAQPAPSNRGAVPRGRRGHPVPRRQLSVPGVTGGGAVRQTPPFDPRARIRRTFRAIHADRVEARSRRVPNLVALASSPRSGLDLRGGLGRSVDEFRDQSTGRRISAWCRVTQSPVSHADSPPLPYRMRWMDRFARRKQGRRGYGQLQSRSRSPPRQHRASCFGFLDQWGLDRQPYTE